VIDPRQVSLDVAGQAMTLEVKQLRDAADFELTPRAAPLKQIASATHGEFHSIADLPKLWSARRKSSGHDQHERVSAARCRLWSGPWSLVALLGMASAEYLLRRRAGRVM
jgi:hypothetical protein